MSGKCFSEVSGHLPVGVLSRKEFDLGYLTFILRFLNLWDGHFQTLEYIGACYWIQLLNSMCIRMWKDVFYTL